MNFLVLPLKIAFIWLIPCKAIDYWWQVNWIFNKAQPTLTKPYYCKFSVILNETWTNWWKN